MDVADVRREVLGAAEDEFQQAGLLEDTPYREAGLAAVEAVLEAPNQALTMEDWNRLVPDGEVICLSLPLSLCLSRSCLPIHACLLHVYQVSKFEINFASTCWWTISPASSVQTGVMLSLPPLPLSLSFSVSLLPPPSVCACV